ncbi:inositol 2-dehydrogenase [Pseudactinotalea suaedae]|uniref:inositol 2-dehydrogenase n=1 Tax=Pseudactinotalea suaedae TaxID=1524924 RepID=UPI0012E2DC60|nr:inositol 2-dehydrogenase [Pseudactinotalea suaedae]
MTDRLRIAVIGAGRIGAVHARTIRHHLRADLVLVADAHAGAAARLAEDLGAESTDDVDAALTSDAVDAVVVASPTPLHVPHTLTAVGAGKSVLMEKPVALEVEQVDACIAELGDRAGRVMVGFNRRFDPSVSEVHARVRAGDIGTVEQVTIVSRDPAPPPSEYLKVSGGIFKDMTIHDLDMARHLIGDVRSVHAVGQHLDPEVDDLYDAATVTLTGRSGAVAVIVNSRHSVAGYDQRIEVFGSAGALEVTNQRSSSVRLHNADGTEQSGPFLPFFLERYQRAYAAELDTFVEAAVTGAAQSPSIADGRAALALAEAAGSSARTGTTITLEDPS